MLEYDVQSADAWEALCIERFQLCRVDWAASSFVANLQTTASIPQLSLHVLTADPFGVSRTPIDVRQHDSDDLMLVIHDLGSPGQVEHRDTRSELRPGDAVLIDTRRPYTFDYTTPIQQTVLKLNRSSAGRLDAAVGRVIHSAEGPLGRVFRKILDELVDLSSTSRLQAEPSGPAAGRGVPTGGNGIEAASLAAAAVDILAAIYNADPSLNNRLLGREALMKTAKDFVRSRFRDPQLSPALIAQYLRISPRLVAQVFADSGTSPAAFIREERVQEAAGLLRSPAHRDAAIFDIGLRVGFADATTFTRAFKRVYGTAPSEFRAQEAAGFPGR
ncbi:helix-turn-helix domain-containing protein [Arthrobacter sp. KNU40]|uniref:helix-turn-helix domain-containing protein n=1 Tax=Arthrobacter sp. KNU40 TaxID=3447965 RepID=UPI003F603AA9